MKEVELKRQYAIHCLQADEPLGFVAWTKEFGFEKRPIYKKVCPFCGKEYETENSKQWYCSETCKYDNFNQKRKNERKRH